MTQAGDLGRNLLQLASRYGGMEVSDARQLKSLGDENRPLEVYQRSRAAK